jgi:apolipoprotein N-acyltransferase
VLFLTFPVLVWLIDGTAAGRYGGLGVAAITGWWFGFGYFLAGLYWVGYAFLVDAQTFGWLLPFAVMLLPAGLAFFTALGFVLARLLWTRGPGRILALALALTLSEWLRGNVLTGFPWNTFGYTLTGSNALAQSASLIGLWGLTFVAVAVFASAATLTDDRNETRRPWLPVAVSLAVLVALAIFGTMRLANTPTAFVDGVKLRIMQPNLSQDDKFNYLAKASVMSRYLALSDRATGPQSMGVRDATHLIWPESAFPFFLAREPDALAQIAALLPQGTVLITGGVREPDTSAQRQARRAYNSIYVVDHDGSILSVYDKVHLVPFGEYLPFQNWAEKLGLIPLTKVPGFLSGDRRRPMEVPRAPPFLPLICYEIIFPDEAVPAGERPGWLLNLTNDGWFGISSGPYQHLRQSRLRAIEHGLPLVRAANTGISAVVDPLGRVVASLPLGTDGVLDAQLPKPAAVTIYRRFGGTLVAVFIFVILIGLVRRRMTSR